MTNVKDLSTQKLVDIVNNVADMALAGREYKDTDELCDAANAELQARFKERGEYVRLSNKTKNYFNQPAYIIGEEVDGVLIGSAYETDEAKAKSYRRVFLDREIKEARKNKNAKKDSYKTSFDDYFFNESIRHISKKWFEFNRVADNDNITIITGNVVQLGNYRVLLVGEGRGVWLKDWQVKSGRCAIEGTQYGAIEDCYAVKLNRKYFNVKDIKLANDDFYFEKEQGFNDLLQIAKDQDEVNIPVSF